MKLAQWLQQQRKKVTPGVKPVATKSQHFSQEDRSFIQDNIDKM